MDRSRFDARRSLSSAWARVRGWMHLGGGEGGRESEGRDQGGPALSDAERHLTDASIRDLALRANGRCMAWTWDRPTDFSPDGDAVADLAAADRLVCRWNDSEPTLDDLWLARDLYAFHGRYDNAEAVLWHIRSLIHPCHTPAAAAGPYAQAGDPPCSGSGTWFDPGPVSPGSEGQKPRETPGNGGSPVW